MPQAGTPLADVRPGGDADELLTIAAMRLAMPDRFIPASLDVDGIAGLERRLRAGANVVTSIVPPTVASPASRRPSSTSTRATAPCTACCRTSSAWACGRPAWTSTASGWPRRPQRPPGERMRLLIVGGKLQGTEAAYLAGKAGWDTVLVDRREAPPAAGIAHEHVQADVTADEAVARSS